LFIVIGIPTDQPIEDSIILNFYQTSERCNDAIQILKKKQRSDGLWQADTSYMKSAWIDFDIPKKPGL